ncbi:MAG: biopolymer transporter ExbD [Pseudomonadota bacterium]
MLKFQSRTKRVKPEPTIALINIVFLMLIFFLVAAQVAPPLEQGLDLVETSDLDGREPPDSMVILADGTLKFRGADVTPAQYVTVMQEETGELAALRLVPDRELPAVKLIEIGNELRAAGVETIRLVTERSLESGS